VFLVVVLTISVELPFSGFNFLSFSLASLSSFASFSCFNLSAYIYS